MGELRRITVRGTVVDENNDDRGYYAVIEQDESESALTPAGRVALAAARSALSDGRDVGANTVAVLVLELQRLAGICPVCGDREHERVEYKPGVFVTPCPAIPDGFILPDGSIERPTDAEGRWRTRRPGT
jgi:hypothetical protein